MCLRNNTLRKAYWLHSLLSDGPKTHEIIGDSFISLFHSFNPSPNPYIVSQRMFLVEPLATHTSPAFEGSPCSSLLFLCQHFLHKTFGSSFSQTVFSMSFPGSVSTIYSLPHTHHPLCFTDNQFTDTDRLQCTFPCIHLANIYQGIGDIRPSFGRVSKNWLSVKIA